jgi:hypothetical protein
MHAHQRSFLCASQALIFSLNEAYKVSLPDWCGAPKVELRPGPDISFADIPSEVHHAWFLLLSSSGKVEQLHQLYA